MKRLWRGQKNDGAIDWTQVRRVLLIRLRSIGDTVLMTPCLTVLKQFRPSLRLTVLSERLAAPLLEGHPDVDELILLDRALNQWRDGLQRARLVRRLRAANFDMAFNLHGGTTATLLCYLSRAPCRVGYAGYRYARLHTHRAPDPEIIWDKPTIHSVEQQLGLLKWTGIPIRSIPGPSLYAGDSAYESVFHRLARVKVGGPVALIHPAATAEDKRWPTAKFASVVKYLAAHYGLSSLVLGARHEAHVLENLKESAGRSASIFTDLHLKEVIALCSMACIFIGNDSGPAHIAMAMGCPSVVIFGSSDPQVWRPWGDTHNAIVRAETDFSGRRLEPCERISHVQVEDVIQAIDQVMTHTHQASVAPDPPLPGIRRRVT